MFIFMLLSFLFYIRIKSEFADKIILKQVTIFVHVLFFIGELYILIEVHVIF